MTEQTIPNLSDIAARHGLSKGAAEAALVGLRSGQARQAQFNHPDLGGMGQWSQGGMLMIGEMFSHGLKAKVAALFEELAPLAGKLGPSPDGASANTDGTADRWPAELGAASSSGSQNDMHYAIFSDTRRLAVEQAGKVTIYDIGDRRITGVAQQQSHDQSLRFTGPDGTISTADLPITESGPASTSGPAPNVVTPSPAAARSEGDEDIAARIERLHALLTQGALTQAEFDEAKRKLLREL